MNTKQVITAAVISLIGSAAFAQAELELQHFGGSQPAASATTTRAAVRNEVLRARAAGELVATTEGDVAGVLSKPSKSSASALTRSEVRAEVLKARADGSLTRSLEVDAIGDRNVASVRTREEVRNEAIAATRAPRVQAGH